MDQLQNRLKTKQARICFSTRTIPWIGIHGAQDDSAFVQFPSDEAKRYQPNAAEPLLQAGQMPFYGCTERGCVYPTVDLDGNKQMTDMR